VEKINTPFEAGRGDVLSPMVLLRSALPGCGGPSLEEAIVSPAFVLIWRLV
jgi:hypothetical protein